MLVEFKNQPELGVWRIITNITNAHNRVVFICPYENVPDGLVALAEYATISVRRSVLRLHRPQQKETLIP
jgi:hypothetical protein